METDDFKDWYDLILSKVKAEEKDSSTLTWLCCYMIWPSGLSTLIFLLPIKSLAIAFPGRKKPSFF